MRDVSGNTIFYSGFEEATPPFGVDGNPTWAGTTARAAAGQWSAYCAGSAVSPPGPYYNNMRSWLIAGPFDLSSLTSGTFSFQTYFDTELDRDFLAAYVSLDRQNFYGEGYTGSSQGWVTKSLDLTNVYTLGNVCGRPQVWIAFFFSSDASVTREGAYVDEVRIVGGGGGGGVRDVGLILAADAEVVPYNGSVGLSGALLDLDTQGLLPNKEVGLFWSQENKIDGQWNFAGTATSSTGEYGITASGIQKLTYFALFFDGDAQYNSGISNLVKIMSRAKITPPAVPSRVRSGVLTTSWGSIKPPHTTQQNQASHTKVNLERYYAGRWRAVVTIYANKYKNSSSETRYSIGLRYKPGTWRVRAVHQDDDHAKSTSSWRTFTVR